MINESKRILPTFRYDEVFEHPDATEDLRTATQMRYIEAYKYAEYAGETSRIPLDIVLKVINVNVEKRSRALKAALIDVNDGGNLNLPPDSVLPTIFQIGEPIPGIEDDYLDADYPSREVFAYNRVGKRSFLNKAFARHCLKMLDIAYPGSEIVTQEAPLRVKAHRKINGTDWAVVSAKQLIDTRRKNGRETSLISRTTGVVNMKDEQLFADEIEAIQELIDYQNRQRRGGETLSDTEAELYRSAVRSMIMRPESGLVLPVIQTVYQTQSRVAGQYSHES